MSVSCRKKSEIHSFLSPLFNFSPYTKRMHNTANKVAESIRALGHCLFVQRMQAVQGSVSPMPKNGGQWVSVRCKASHKLLFPNFMMRCSQTSYVYNFTKDAGTGTFSVTLLWLGKTTWMVSIVMWIFPLFKLPRGTWDLPPLHSGLLKGLQVPDSPVMHTDDNFNLTIKFCWMVVDRRVWTTTCWNSSCRWTGS